MQRSGIAPGHSVSTHKYAQVWDKHVLFEGWRLFQEIMDFQPFVWRNQLHSKNQPLSQEGLCFDLHVLALEMGCGASATGPALQAPGLWPVHRGQSLHGALIYPGTLGRWHT